MLQVLVFGNFGGCIIASTLTNPLRTPRTVRKKSRDGMRRRGLICKLNKGEGNGWISFMRAQEAVKV